MPSVTLNRLTGYRRSQRGRQRRPIIRSIRTLRIRQTYGLDFSTAASILPFPAATMLTPTGIFMNFRGPSALNGRLRKARSLRYPSLKLHPLTRLATLATPSQRERGDSQKLRRTEH